MDTGQGGVRGGGQQIYCLSHLTKSHVTRTCTDSCLKSKKATTKELAVFGGVQNGFSCKYLHVDSVLKVS